jgi:Tol biopolymer transport system component
MKFTTISIRRFILLAVPCSALLVYVMATARRVHANVPGTNGQITYTQGVLDFNGGAPANVFTADSNGSNAQQVLLPNGIRVELFSLSVWSPDGKKLLLSHTLRIDPSTGQCCLFQPATVKPDGSEFNQLVPPTPPGGPSANGIDCPVWSLDQTRILCAFNDSTSGIAGVFSIRASDGGDPVRLTTNPYNSNELPTDVSPDGTQFVFLRFRQPNTDPTQQVAIFVENMDGTGLHQVTPYGLAHAHEYIAAQWSPDGTKIISQTQQGRLFTVSPNGARVTPIVLQTGTGRYFAFGPHWSPDGTRIIFCMFINGGEGLYTANPDGSDVQKVTFTTDFSEFFYWPDWGRQPIQ